LRVFIYGGLPDSCFDFNIARHRETSPKQYQKFHFASYTSSKSS
jgi:hypothetical protein